MALRDNSSKKKKLISVIRSIYKRTGRVPNYTDYKNEKGALSDRVIYSCFPTFKDALDAAGLLEEFKRLEEIKKESRHDKRVADLELELEQTKDELHNMEKRLNIFTAINIRTIDSQPDWLQRGGQEGITGIPVLFISDFHLDEVVEKKQVDGVNEFNRKIAIKRLKHTFQTTIDLCNKYMYKPKYDGFVLCLGGDIVSGEIHEELTETNEAPILDTCFLAVEIIAQGIEALLENFDKVFVPCVVGNHGRRHRKPRAKFKVKDNYEWMIYKLLQKHFEKNSRVKFLIPESSDCTFSIYGKTFLLTHGDQFKGGAGISGIFSPLMLGHHRKSKRQAAVKKPFDVMMIGHWHQYIHTESLIVNGSVKGYDEYAAQCNFPFEPPQQALFIVNRHRGIIYRNPVLCEDLDAGSQKALQIW